MAMTREQVLAEMEEGFTQMSEEDKTTVLFSYEDKDWSPNLLLEEVRQDTDFGKKYVEEWSRNKEDRMALESLLDTLLGAGDGMTCGDPQCTNCRGEKRLLDQG